MQKKTFLTPIGLVRQYNSPKLYCSPSIIIQGNFHLSKHPNERFDRFFHKFNFELCHLFLVQGIAEAELHSGTEEMEL